jgi:predicted nucleotidyltransferase
MEAGMARLTKGDILARREAITRLARAHGAADIRLFGSLARDEADAASDIDFLVTPAAVTPPFFPGGLIAALEDLLGVEVQVTLDSPHLGGRFRAAIDRDLVAL